MPKKPPPFPFLAQAMSADSKIAEAKPIKHLLSVGFLTVKTAQVLIGVVGWVRAFFKHCRLFMSVDRHAEDTVASISQLIKLVQFDFNYTVAQVSIGRGIPPFQARAQNK